MKSWRVELTCGAEIFGQVPIKKGVFQGDALSPLLFLNDLMPLTHILGTANPRYEFQTGETINHLLFMDDLKLHSKYERVFDYVFQTVKIFTEDIEVPFGMDKSTVLVMKMGKIRWY